MRAKRRRHRCDAQSGEEKFGSFLHRMKWINLGGGHHITRDGYDIKTLKQSIVRLQDTYKVQVYLEPGEAIALNAGFLQTQVLEIVNNGIDIAILDTSAACHMPDVLEMPYRPPLLGAGQAGEKPHTYAWAGPPAWPGTSSVTIPLTAPSVLETAWCLATWPFIPW
jgi:carboxynorspermidine decarboxylase